MARRLLAHACVRLPAAARTAGQSAHKQAETFCRQALAQRLQLGDRLGEAHTWDSLGYIEHQLGNLTDAAGCHHRALDIFRDLGDRYGEAQMLTHLGDVHRTAGNLVEAAHAWQQALVILQDLHHPDAAQIRARLHQPGTLGIKPAKTRA